ncbi:ERCC4 domain-containing protein [Microbulbifer sp.]|uniref:ERCC4 domain-containing protein n=1 Tax=Microbulbifer sp. TaxID=1908541 RepID=UPI003F3D08CF
MQIAVGHREKAPPLLAELHRRGLAIQRARLPLGDYLIKEHLLFKRKTIPDLLASLTDGRLFRQARQLYHWRA